MSPRDPECWAQRRQDVHRLLDVVLTVHEHPEVAATAADLAADLVVLRRDEHGTHVDLERLLGATVDVVTALSAAFAETVDVPWAVALEATRTGLDHVLGRMEGNQPPSW